jgi:hypothetical protein
LIALNAFDMLAKPIGFPDHGDATALLWDDGGRPPAQAHVPRVSHHNCLTSTILSPFVKTDPRSQPDTTIPAWLEWREYLRPIFSSALLPYIWIWTNLQDYQQQRYGVSLNFLADWQNQIDHLLAQEEVHQYPLSEDARNALLQTSI